MENSNANQIPMTILFNEKVNVKKCLKLSTLQNTELKELFWEKDMLFKDNKEWKWSSYFRHIKKYIQTAIKKNGLIRNEYKFGKYNYDGRLYVNNSLGLQSLQGNLRNYISGEYYKDYDIKNCHPSILLFLCEKYEIESSFLKKYIIDRSSVLSEDNITKLDYLIALNTDDNKNKRDKNLYNGFITELKTIKNKLLTKFDDEGCIIFNTNDKNPISSKINKLLCKYENDIIQKAINYIKPENVGVPMFDGLLVDNSIDVNLIELNDLFKEYKYIEFIEKSTFTDLTIEHQEFIQNTYDYEDVKKDFEKNHFQLLKPFSYWKIGRDLDSCMTYSQISDKGIKDIASEYKIINPENNKITSIYNMWIADKKKRRYDNIVFEPYGKIDNCPPYSFNSFDGFQINKLDTDGGLNIDNFNEFIYCLCGENYKHDKPKSKWLINYLAHMFQYPNERTEKIVIFKGLQGAGKDTLYQLLRKLMGVKYVSIVDDLEEIFGNFNNVLENKIALFINELDGKDGYDHRSKLKSLATSITNNINNKNEKKIEQANHMRVFGASNGVSPVDPERDDRRYIIIQTGLTLIANTNNKSKKEYSQKFFNKFYDDMDNHKWLKSVYEYLMNIDLSKFNPRREHLKTEEYNILKEKNCNSIYTYLKTMLDNNNSFHTAKYINDSMYIHKGEWSYIMYKDFKDAFYDYCENELNITIKYKDSYIKTMLIGMDGSYKIPSRMKYTQRGNIMRETRMGFNFKKVDKFFREYIDLEETQNEIDLGEIK